MGKLFIGLVLGFIIGTLSVQQAPGASSPVAVAQAASRPAVVQPAPVKVEEDHPIPPPKVNRKAPEPINPHDDLIKSADQVVRLMIYKAGKLIDDQAYEGDVKPVDQTDKTE